MDDLSTYGWVFGPLIGLASFMAAWRRGRGAKARQQRLADELTAARAELSDVPGKILEAIAPALQGFEGSAADGEVERGLVPEDFVAYVGYVDVTNDGTPELLVLHPAGVHASLLKVFGTMDTYSGFQLLDELHSGVAGGFEVGDFDGDGLAEIATVNADFDRGPDRAYANAILVENLHRWGGFGFEHVGEGEVYDPESGAPIPPRIQQLLGRPSWALK